MKFSIKLLIVTIILAVSSLGIYAKTLKEVKLLTNMTCAECKGKIENALTKAKGVDKVDANVSTKVVKVKYDADITKSETIIKTVKDLGYSAEEVKGEVKSKKDKCCDPNEKTNKK